MDLNIGLLIVIFLFAIGIGLIIAFLGFLIKMSLYKIKALKQLKENRGVFEVYGMKNENKAKDLQQENMQVNKKKTLNLLKNLISKDKESYLEKFNKANNELNRLKMEYNNGKMGYNELKKAFEYYQNQEYYRRVLNGRNR